MVHSVTLKEDSENVMNNVEPIKFVFQLATGNAGSKTIIEPMLKTYSVANQRARGEFMEYGYSKRYVDFSTYRTDIFLNQIILVNGLKFKVMDISINSTIKTMRSTIRGVRYE